MRVLTKEFLEKLRSTYPPGTRLELINMNDKQAPPAGTCGTVMGVDDTGNIMMHWDNGSYLSLIFDVDEYKIADKKT